MAAIVTTGLLFKGMPRLDFHHKNSIQLKKLLKDTSIGLLIFTLVAFFILVPYFYSSQGYLSGDRFVEIYGNFRIPHHAIPSYFLSKSDPLLHLTFLAIIIGSLQLSFFNKRNLENFKFYLGMIFATTILLFCGYIFVELIPTRIFTTLVPFMKLGTIWAWIGLIFISGTISDIISKPNIGRLAHGLVITIYAYYFSNLEKLYACIFIFIMLAFFIIEINSLRIRNTNKIKKIIILAGSIFFCISFFSQSNLNKFKKNYKRTIQYITHENYNLKN